MCTAGRLFSGFRMGEKEQFLYLTTTGRRTGKPREIEIWYVELAGRFYIIAEHGERANWVRNIQADPKITIRVGQRETRGSGRVVDRERDVALHRAISEAFKKKYGWSDGLIVELAPDA